VADALIAYSDRLKAPGRKANDFSVAKRLNELVTDIFILVAGSTNNEIDTSAVNKSYVLLVHELKKIYQRNTELSSIEVMPIWKHFDIIEGLEYEISQYTNDWNNDSGQSHTARVNQLCIVSGKEKPEYTPGLNTIVKDADKAVAAYSKKLSEKQEKKKAVSRDWFIPSYKVTYSLDGSIIVNDVLKLKKVHAGSISDRLMGQAVKNKGSVFKPDLGKTARNLSTILSSMGFKGTLRALFFPVVSKDKGVLFRPIITNDEVLSEKIDTTALDALLKKEGATTEAMPIDLSDIPF